MESLSRIPVDDGANGILKRYVWMQIFSHTDNKKNNVFENTRALVDTVCDGFITHALVIFFVRSKHPLNCVKLLLPRLGVALNAFLPPGLLFVIASLSFLCVCFLALSVIPLNVTANLSCSICVNVTWTIEGLERGLILQSFVVSYKALKDVTWMSVDVPANQTSTVLNNLKFYTKYEIKVAAFTANLTGNFSVPIKVTTNEGGEKS